MCKRERQVGAAKTNEREREREKKENREGVRERGSEKERAKRTWMRQTESKAYEILLIFEQNCM